MQFHYHDSLDKPNHPAARVIQKELRELQTDIERGKAPRSIEARLHTVQHQLEQAHRSGYDILSPNHHNDFEHRFNHLRDDIRHLPHY